MTSEGRGILSPVRLPVPPLQQVYGSFEFTVLPATRTVVVSVVVLGPMSRKRAALRATEVVLGTII